MNGNDSGNDTEGFGNFSDPEFGIVFDESAGFFGVKFIVNIFGGEMIFDNFVFDDAHPGLFDGGFSKGNTAGGGGRATAEELSETLNHSGTLLETIEIDYKTNVMANMKWTNEWIRDVAKPNREFLFLLEK